MENKYNYADLVKFKLAFNNKTQVVRGYIFIVDKYGTFEQNEEPSYDVLLRDLTLIKHIRESNLTLIKKADKDAIKYLDEVLR